MAFITEDDIKTAIDSNVLDLFKAKDESIIPFAIEAAQSQVEGYLNYYDCDTIFSKSGTDRNTLLIQFIRDIAVFNMIGIFNPGIDYEDKKDRHDRAVRYLERVQAGKATPVLPKKAEEEKVNKITSGSNKKRNNHY